MSRTPRGAELRKSLGREIRKARQGRGLSQEKLAGLCDLDRTYIGLLERAEKSPTVDTLLRVALALGEMPSDLLARAEAASESRAK
jgi:transcriptional regulator with XRE-family HTH domain